MADKARQDVIAHLFDLGAKVKDKPDAGSSALYGRIRHLGSEDFDETRRSLIPPRGEAPVPGISRCIRVPARSSHAADGGVSNPSRLGRRSPGDALSLDPRRSPICSTFLRVANRNARSGLRRQLDKNHLDGDAIYPRRTEGLLG